MALWKKRAVATASRVARHYSLQRVEAADPRRLTRRAQPTPDRRRPAQPARWHCRASRRSCVVRLSAVTPGIPDPVSV